MGSKLYPLKGSFASPIVIKGIYSFIQNNREFICDILTQSIPFGKITNYESYCIFNIIDSAQNRFTDNIFLRIETTNKTSSQGHCYVYNDDKIEYVTQCTVMDIIINLYKKELRNDKINSLFN